MKTILETRGLSKTYTGAGITVHALRDATLQLYEGETLGVIGKSGSGKSTLAKILSRLEKPTEGSALLGGKDIFALNRREEKAYSLSVQMVFQNPYAACDPTKRIAAIVTEGLSAHGIFTARERLKRASELLESVGLDGEFLRRKPGQLSGGQLQRVCIARALAVNPRVLICDEPTSSLDVSVQAQIVNLLTRIQRENGLSMLFIGHDLNLLRYVSHRVAVLHEGEIIECAPSDEIFSHPTQPYTKRLVTDQMKGMIV